MKFLLFSIAYYICLCLAYLVIQWAKKDCLILYLVRRFTIAFSLVKIVHGGHPLNLLLAKENMLDMRNFHPFDIFLITSSTEE